MCASTWTVTVRRGGRSNLSDRPSYKVLPLSTLVTSSEQLLRICKGCYQGEAENRRSHQLEPGCPFREFCDYLDYND
jgi:hypothetical protein